MKEDHQSSSDTLLNSVIKLPAEPLSPQSLKAADNSGQIPL
jgi:hypothetical protein